MRRKLCSIFLIVLLLIAAGCEAKSTNSDSMVENNENVIPFKERLFIYTNGIKTEDKSIEKKDEAGVSIRISYPIISGLKDTAVQDKINNEISNLGSKLLTELEADISGSQQKVTPKLHEKRSRVGVAYNCNNVLFVDCGASIEYGSSRYIDKNVAYGFDLNTGERIKLADIFKPGSNYETKINNYICQYIIENNLDDYSREMMNKPFQGIKKDQSFSFSSEGLRIKIDKKNDEFTYFGYWEDISIPLEYFGDDLYILDKYFDEGKNIYTKEKLNKKLLPNKFKFAEGKPIMEEERNYSITISNGEFVDIPDKNIEAKLNEMLICRYDIDSFREKAKSFSDKQHSMFYHSIHIVNNAGGYLSVAIADEVFYEGKNELNRLTFNYDFNNNKELLLKDIFMDADYAKGIIKSYMKRTDYPIKEEIVEKRLEEVFNTSNFNFNEYGIEVEFLPQNTDLDYYSRNIWIPFEEIGMDNTTVFN